MGFIDLHVHSTASDGTLTPTEIVNYAVSKGLDAIALTDHDTIDGIKEALAAAANQPLEVIPGIELSCMYENQEIHILGLFVNCFDFDFLSKLENLRQIRNQRNDEMVRRFQQDGMMISIEDLTDGHPETVITRAHFARVLTAKGYAASPDQAFKKYLQYSGPYCVRREKTSAEHVMELLTASGAYPVIAHPMQYEMGYQQVEQMISYLKNLGLRGVEAFHSSNNQHQSRKLRELAKRYDLLTTGGSDFHGSNKPDIDLGTGRGKLRLSHLLLEDIKKDLRTSSLNEKKL